MCAKECQSISHIVGSTKPMPTAAKTSWRLGGRLMWKAVVSRVEKVDEEVGMNGEGGIVVCWKVSEVEVY